ncbi:MAG TPA: hypothetical protein DEQ14_10540 [Treponema sp.]|nr:hypothetical protein [Treponema sp.]
MTRNLAIIRLSPAVLSHRLLSKKCVEFYRKVKLRSYPAKPDSHTGIAQAAGGWSVRGADGNVTVRGRPFGNRPPFLIQKMRGVLP